MKLYDGGVFAVLLLIFGVILGTDNVPAPGSVNEQEVLDRY